MKGFIIGELGFKRMRFGGHIFGGAYYRNLTVYYTHSLIFFICFSMRKRSHKVGIITQDHVRGERSSSPHDGNSNRGYEMHTVRVHHAESNA